MNAARKFPEAPPPPPPEEFNTTPPPKSVVARVLPTTFAQYAEWAIPMLQEDFGNPSRSVILRWVQQWPNDNTFCFVGTPNGLGLAVLLYEPLRSDPTVQEIFLYVRGAENKHEGVEIYQHFAQWAKLLRAWRFRWNASAGAPMDEVKAAFPKMRADRLWYVDLA